MRFSINPSLGVRIIAIWALILVVSELVNLLLLSATVEYSDQSANQAQVWLIFILSIGFGLAFAVSAYGLWQRQTWGRVLFLWTITIWAGFNILGLILPNLIFASESRHSFGAITVNLIRFVLTLVIPLWYLNRAQIKAVFYRAEPDNISP